MSWISDQLDNLNGYAQEASDYVSQALDFGFNTDRQEALSNPNKAVNPEIDIQEIDRSNPTNVLYGTIAGVPSVVVYAVGAVAVLIVLKKAKVF